MGERYRQRQQSGTLRNMTNSNGRYCLCVFKCYKHLTSRRRVTRRRSCSCPSDPAVKEEMKTIKNTRGDFLQSTSTGHEGGVKVRSGHLAPGRTRDVPQTRSSGAASTEPRTFSCSPPAVQLRYRTRLINRAAKCF